MPVARRRERLQALAAEIQGEYGVKTLVISADLALEEGVERVLEAASELEVGLLVASAGFGTSGPFLEGELALERSMLRVNCEAVLSLSHHFARRFTQQGRGGIILLSSLVAFQGVPHAGHYAATKAWVQTLAEGLHLELAPYGVQVLASAPGPTASGFADRANMVMGAAEGPEVVARGTLDALGRQMTVRPGFLSKALEVALTLPRGLRARIMAKVMGGMTEHQRLPAPGAAS